MRKEDLIKDAMINFASRQRLKSTEHKAPKTASNIM